MGLEKVTYVDGSTVITAQNLNAIQDSIIDLEASRTVPTNVRNAIYTLLENAAYATTGLEDEIAVVEAWAEEVTSLTLSVSTLSLNNDVPKVITATTVPNGSTVTWSSSNNSVATVSNGIVTGVSNGSCVITAYAGELVATCDVTVEGFAVLESISAVYTQSGTVYDTDSLDSLKADLVVTATYDDSSTETIPSTDYTLSGTLTVGTSTITVAYGGKTTTFNVTVSWKTSYVISDGEVVKASIATTSGTHSGDLFVNVNAGALANRRAFLLTNAKIRSVEYSPDDGTTFLEDVYFPLPIPSTSTGVSVSVTPNTLQMALSAWRLDANNKYVRDSSPTWQTGTGTLSFTAGTYTALTVLLRVNSSNSSFSSSTEPTAINVTFS